MRETKSIVTLVEELAEKPAAPEPLFRLEDAPAPEPLFRLEDAPAPETEPACRHCGQPLSRHRLNIPLFEKVRRHILDFPEKFDWRGWSYESDCGTQACICGWVNMFAGRAADDWPTAARDLGLKGEYVASSAVPIGSEAQLLFIPELGGGSGDAERTDDMYFNASCNGDFEAAARIACDYIDRFVAARCPGRELD